MHKRMTYSKHETWTSSFLFQLSTSDIKFELSTEISNTNIISFILPDDPRSTETWLPVLQTWDDSLVSKMDARGFLSNLRICKRKFDELWNKFRCLITYVHRSRNFRLETSSHDFWRRKTFFFQLPYVQRFSTMSTEWLNM